MKEPLAHGYTGIAHSGGLKTVAGYAALAAALILLLTAGCGAPDLEHAGLVKITDRVYAFIADGPSAGEGLGANSGFIVGTDGVLVVDSRYTPALAQILLDNIRTVTDAPIRYVVNTHYHPDHVWGNSVFKGEGARIVSHAITRSDIEKYSPHYIEYYKNANKESYELIKDVEIVLPDTTFDKELTLDLGGVEVVLHHFGPGHTAGDCVVSVPEERIVFTGGLAANGYHLNLGDTGGDFDNWAATLLRLANTDIRYVVPSQGFVAGPELLEQCRNYIETLRAQCRREVQAGSYLSVVALTMKLPGTEGYFQENLLPFNVRAVCRKEIINVLDPNFAFDLPEQFEIDDGGMQGNGGRIKWVWNSPKGKLEIEVQWSPSGRKEILPQDVTDRVGRTVEANKGVLSMEVDGTKKLKIADQEAPAAFGTFKIISGTMQVGSGIWTWSMFPKEGTLYSIQLSTDAERQKEQERENMKLLETIAKSFRITKK